MILQTSAVQARLFPRARRFDSAIDAARVLLQELERGQHATAETLAAIAAIQIMIDGAAPPSSFPAVSSEDLARMSEIADAIRSTVEELPFPDREAIRDDVDELDDLIHAIGERS